MTESMVLGLYVVSGVVAGFAFQRSRLCFVSALRDLFLFGDTGMTRGIVALLGLTALIAPAATGWRLPGPSIGPAPADLVLGGGLFGIGMVLAGSCASGALWRLGEGQRSQVWILAGLLAGTWLWVALPLGGAPQVQRWLSPWISVALAGLAYVGLTLWERSRQLDGEELPPLRRPGRPFQLPWPPLAGAAVVALALAGFLALTGQTWRLTSLFLLDDLEAALFACGLVGGGFAGARLGHEWRLRGAGGLREGALRFTGGLLMGYGARLGWGCTIGALLSGMATATLQAWLWLAGAVLGAWLGARLLRLCMNWLR